MSIKRERYSGVAGVSILFDPATEWALYEIRVHLGAVDGATENLVIQQKSSISDKYDYIFDTEAFAALADYEYLPTRPRIFTNGDKLSITLANANSRAWGVEIIYE